MTTSENSQENCYLICHTAKYKLHEAEFFLRKLKEPYIFNNDDEFSFYLNAFIFSAGCIPDYVHADFIFNTIRNPRIKWREWENRDHKVKNQIIKSHPDSNAINNFITFFKKQKIILWNDPIVNYFLYKRNKITHVRWDSDKEASYEQKSDGTKEYHIRRLEPMWLSFILVDHPDYNLDLFYDQIPKPIQIQTISRLNDESIITILEEYVNKLKKFIDLFEGKDFFTSVDSEL